MSMHPNRCKDTWDDGGPRHTHASTMSGVHHKLLTSMLPIMFEALIFLKFNVSCWDDALTLKVAARRWTSKDRSIWKSIWRTCRLRRSWSPRLVQTVCSVKIHCLFSARGIAILSGFKFHCNHDCRIRINCKHDCKMSFPSNPLQVNWSWQVSPVASASDRGDSSVHSFFPWWRQVVVRSWIGECSGKWIGWFFGWKLVDSLSLVGMCWKEVSRWSDPTTMVAITWWLPKGVQAWKRIGLHNLLGDPSCPVQARANSTLHDNKHWIGRKREGLVIPCCSSGQCCCWGCAWVCHSQPCVSVHRPTETEGGESLCCNPMAMIFWCEEQVENDAGFEALEDNAWWWCHAIEDAERNDFRDRWWPAPMLDTSELFGPFDSPQPMIQRNFHKRFIAASKVIETECCQFCSVKLTIGAGSDCKKTAHGTTSSVIFLAGMDNERCRVMFEDLNNSCLTKMNKCSTSVKVWQCCFCK